MTTAALDAPSPLRSPVVRALAPFLEARTWGALVYVWLSFPLGLAWFVGLTVGLATGAALTILWVGLVLLFLTFLAAWGAEGLERRLAILLLGANVPERRRRPEGTETFRAWLKSVFTRAPLWKGLLFLALRFPLGLAGWTVSVVSLAVSGGFLAAPFALAVGGSVDLGFWSPVTVGEALPISLVGLALLIVTFHLHRAMGWAWARLAEQLLGGAGEPSEPQSAGAIASLAPAE
ncbi:MAG: hypothetical protein AMXMBFR36_05670 [Acidobacteriota bacterium]